METPINAAEPSPEELKAKIAELEAQQSAAVQEGVPGVSGEKTMPAQWPVRGYTGPQPWEATNPPELSHERGFVTSGSAGPDVVEVAALLEELGYPTAISQGQNPHAIYGESERAAVAQFRSEWGVQEAPEIVAATTRSVVGPWTWEALFRAARASETEAVTA